MPEYKLSPETFSNLKGKVVVLTGGANGVGECVVRTLFGIGAHVVFGDINEKRCAELAKELTASSAISSGGSVIFRKVDVRNYEDNLALFDAALEKHKHVDHAMSFAGVTEGQNWFEPQLDLKSIRDKPSTAVLDINLLGVLYFTRIAAVYLRQNSALDGSKTDKSILLTGSLAAFAEQAGLFVYSPSKHGVMGLYRGVRRNLHEVHGIRVNLVNPSLIATGMASKVQHMWDEKKLPVNQPQQVADVAINVVASSATALSVYVEGGLTWEMEADLDRLQPQWMGPDGAKNLIAINEMLGVGAGWTTERPQ